MPFTARKRYWTMLQLQSHLRAGSSVLGSSFDGPPAVSALAVQAPPDGALAWALRGYPHAAFVEVLGANVDSPVVIAPFDELQPPEAQNPQLGSSYVGQSFPVRYSLAPAQATWPDQLNWLMFRRASTQFERVIIWVRQDIQQLQTAQGR